MSSKIVKICYLTEYTLGRIIKAWPRSRYRATSANAVSTLGFRDKGMTKNPRCAQSANRLIGIRPASRIAKRQSGARAGLYACMSTMTVTESSCRMTRTVSARVRKQQSTKPPIRGFFSQSVSIPVCLAVPRKRNSWQITFVFEYFEEKFVLENALSWGEVNPLAVLIKRGLSVVQ